MTVVEQARQHRREARHARAVTIPVRDIISNSQVRKMAGGVTRHTLIAWRERHGFPKPIKTVDRTELWDARQVRAWLAQRDTRRR